MKKCITTYILFVSCLCFCVSGYATQPKTIAVSKSSFSQENTVITAGYTLPSGKTICNDQETAARLAFSHAPGYAAEASIVSFFSSPVFHEIVITPDAERVLKDHLLHLFPSHYFW